MATISKPNTFSAGSTIVAAEHNSNFDTIYNDYNGNITNANVSSAAAIANSKLNLSSINQAISLAGTLTMSSKPIDMAKGADVTSAATTTIWVTDGNFIHITGSTGPITSFGTATQAGAWRIVVFDSTPTITYNATSLILPTSANITAAAGDVALVVAETTANARVLGYWRKDGTALVGATAANALSGSVVNMVNATYVTKSTGTTAMIFDDSAPTNSEGDEFFTKAITPSNTSNLLRIDVVVWCGSSSATDKPIVALYQDSTSASLNSAVVEGPNLDSVPVAAFFTHWMTAGTTSSTTFKIRAGSTNGSTFTINGAAGSRVLGGVLTSSMTITEIKS